MPKEEAKTLSKNIGALLLHKVGAVILNSSDNIIISKFVGVVSVGLFSNYSLIINAVKTTFDMVIGAVLEQALAIYVQKNLMKKHIKFIVQYFSINTWIGAFCVICSFNLLNPFISLWIGDEYLFPKSAVLAIVISFYIQVTMRTGEMFKSASDCFGMIGMHRLLSAY